MLGLTSPSYLALLPQVLPGPPEAGAAHAIAATTLAGIALAQAAVVAFALGQLVDACRRAIDAVDRQIVAERMGGTDPSPERSMR